MAPSDIWKMPLLRHVAIDGLELSDPLCEASCLKINQRQVQQSEKEAMCKCGAWNQATNAWFMQHGIAAVLCIRRTPFLC
ncbi:hypothetical protein ACS0TY_025620 [Phlomoides rotata]